MLLQRKSRTSVVFVALFCLSFVMMGVAQDSEKALGEDVIVAKVDGKEIDGKTVLQQIDALAASMRQRLSPQEVSQRVTLFYERALERCIEDVLLDEAAVEKKVTVSEEEVKGQIALIMENQKIATDEEFDKFLEQQDVSREELSNIIKTQMSRANLVDLISKDAPAPGEEEIKKFYDDNPKYFKQPESVQASHILLKADANTSDADKSALKEKLEKIKADIESGTITFEDAAKKHSSCPSSAQGGDLGPFGRGKMVKPFEEAAFALKTGEISDIVETQFGYHIIKVTDHNDGGMQPLEKVHDSIQNHLENEAKKDVVTAYIKTLRDNAKVETLVTQEKWQEIQTPKQKEEK